MTEPFWRSLKSLTKTELFILGYLNMRRILFYQVVYHVPLFIFLRPKFKLDLWLAQLLPILGSQSESIRLSFIEIFFKKRNSVWLLICITPQKMSKWWRHYDITIYVIKLAHKKIILKYYQRLKSEILALTESDWPPAVRGWGLLLCN